MTALLPGFADQLAARAETLAAEHAARPSATPRRDAPTPALAARRRFPRVRRLHLPRGRTLGLTILVTGVAASGAAYAAQGLWQPVIGSPDYRQQPGHATASQLPADQLAALSILRRPQTDADRGAASRYALRFAGGDTIRTNEVRLLATLPHGSNAVLIPVAKRASGHLMDEIRGLPPRPDLLCLWIRDPVDGGGQQCGTLADLDSGMLTVGISAPPTPAQQHALQAQYAKAEVVAKQLHRSYVRGGLAGWQLQITTVGLVPDGVAQVRLGRSPRSTVVPVKHNVFITTHRLPQPSSVVWIDAHGEVIQRLTPRAIRPLSGLDSSLKRAVERTRP